MGSKSVAASCKSGYATRMSRTTAAQQREAERRQEEARLVDLTAHLTDKQLGRKILAMRKRAGCTQLELSVAIHKMFPNEGRVMPGKISAYENGERRPGGTVLYKLVHGCGSTGEELVSEGKDGDGRERGRGRGEKPAGYDDLAQRLMALERQVKRLREVR
jgi:transcriptional regulator with XRE-family HTH domain